MLSRRADVVLLGTESSLRLVKNISLVLVALFNTVLVLFSPKIIFISA